MKNSPNFFNWQGNNLEYTNIGNYVVILIIILSLILSIVFKKKIRLLFQKSSNHLVRYKNIDFWFQIFAIMIFLLLIFRIIILSIYQYPFYFEHLLLHLCRLHFLLLALMLLFKRKDKIYFIAYMCFASSILGMFGSTDIDSKYLDIKWANNNSDNCLSIYALNGFTKYSAGPDSYFYWDYHLTHLITGILPVFIFIGINKKIKTITFYRIILIYFSLFISLFIINWLTDFLPTKKWRTNFWYLGTNRNNNFSTFFPPFSMWPYSLITLFLFGICVFYTSHLTCIVMDAKGNVKLKLKEFIMDHKKITIKKLLNLEK